MKWNKQRAPEAPGPPSASLSPSRPAALLPAAFFSFSEDKNLESLIYRGEGISVVLL